MARLSSSLDAMLPKGASHANECMLVQALLAWPLEELWHCQAKR